MLKVAHLTPAYLPQSTTFIWQYLRSLSKVHPIVFCRETMNLDQFPLPNGNIVSLEIPRWSYNWLKSVIYRRILNIPNGDLGRLVFKKKINILHAHFGWTGANFVDFAQKHKLPLITSFYGADATRLDILEVYSKAYQKLFHYGSKFLVEGPVLAEKLIGIGCPSDKIAIQRIAIDLDNYRFKSRSWDQNRSIKLLFVGRLVEKKGLLFALQAVAALVKKYPISFKIIGDGPLANELKEKCKALNIEDNIYWYGFQTHKTVIEELGKCDIFIHPSITASDGNSEGGAPTILIEAQACGVPIISSTHADIPYVTVPGKSILLSPEGDVQGLAKNLSTLIENPKMWESMGKVGRSHVQEFHNIKKEVLNLEKLYMNLSRES